jgi:glycine cleavage system transcriptional repressor
MLARTAATARRGSSLVVYTMEADMHNLILVNVLSPDKTGLVSAISGCLFDLGINLGSTHFAVLGSGAKFTTVCEAQAGISPAEVSDALRALPELAGAKVEVSQFEYSPTTAPNAEVTHRITIQGGDHPGLIARLTEVFIEFEANIVRLNADRVSEQGDDQYVIQIDAWIPVAREHACLASVSNTASSLQMQCSYSKLPAQFSQA